MTKNQIASRLAKLIKKMDKLTEEVTTLMLDIDTADAKEKREKAKRKAPRRISGNALPPPGGMDNFGGIVPKSATMARSAKRLSRP